MKGLAACGGEICLELKIRVLPWPGFPLPALWQRQQKGGWLGGRRGEEGVGEGELAKEDRGWRGAGARPWLARVNGFQGG